MKTLDFSARLDQSQAHPQSPTLRPSSNASKRPGRAEILPSLAPPCRSLASCWRKAPTFAPVSVFSMWPPATAMPPWPPRAASRRSSPPTTCRRYSRRGACARRPRDCTVEFQTADAEYLPFGAETFDVVLSTFGAMFTPQHERPAQEMLRVVRGGGRIGLTNWTPEGFIGQLFKVIGAYTPPPAGLKSPALWGTEPHIVELFGTQAADIRTTRRHLQFPLPVPFSLDPGVSRLLRSDAQSVRRAGFGQATSPGSGHYDTPRASQRRRQSIARRTW